MEFIMTIGEVACAMIEYFGKDRRRINHFMKVYTLADTIAAGEGLPAREREVLGVSALMHDIGIKVSEEKYNSCSGRYQELEGPAEAKKILDRLGADKELSARVCWLIAHHHTYSSIDADDYQILVEADFLVNLDEDNESAEAVKNVRRRIFRTKTGTKLLDAMF